MASNKLDLTGMLFGKLTVIEDTGKRGKKSGAVIWLCRCKCGQFTEVLGGNLTSHHTASCGQCSVNNFYEKDGYKVGVTTKGQDFYFDKEDFELVKRYSWFIDMGYVRGQVNGKNVLLHRLLLPYANEIDHVNNNKRDNRRTNLRPATRSQNMENIPKQDKPTTSKYKGVNWHRHKSKWRAQISIKNVKKHLGYFSNEEEAALAYNKAASFYFGEYANLNVIQTEYPAGLTHEATYKKELIDSLI